MLSSIIASIGLKFLTIGALVLTAIVWVSCNYISKDELKAKMWEKLYGREVKHSDVREKQAIKHKEAKESCDSGSKKCSKRLLNAAQGR